MTNEPDDTDNPPDPFDGIEDSTENDKSSRSIHHPIEKTANIIAWKIIDAYSDESVFEPEERPRGILSQTDREYLYGLKEYAHDQSEANRKQDIRERVEHSLRDFKLLWVLLDTDEREQIFEDMGKEAVNESIESMITFAYLGLEQDLSRLEERIERGILAGENARIEERSSGRATDVSVSIEISYEPDLKALQEQLSRGETDQLTPAEIGVLVRNGMVNSEDIKKLEDTDDDHSHPSNTFIDSLEEETD